MGRIEVKVFWAAAASFFITALFNPGFLFSDEYLHGIYLYLPAQGSSFQNIINESALRSPLQILPFFWLTKLGLMLGLETPWGQYRFMVVGLAIWNFAWLSKAIRMFFVIYEKHRAMAYAILGFHGVLPLVLTRPMFESVGAPLLTVSAAFCFRYWKNRKVQDLLWALLLCVIGAMLRPHVGITGFSIALVVLATRSKKDILVFLIATILLGFLSGYPDMLFFDGKWNHSLFKFIDYNRNHFAEYGVYPFYFYIPVLFAISFLYLVPPRMWKLLWQKDFIVPGLYFLAFFTLHSLASHKEERYMITILPVFFIPLVPVFSKFWDERKNHKIRWGILLGVSGILWLTHIVNVSQKNILELGRYLDLHPQYKTLYSVEESVQLYPGAFIRTANKMHTKITREELPKIAENTSCDFVVVTRQEYWDSLEIPQTLKLIKEVDAGWTEKLLIRLNPKYNLRRGGFRIYACP